MWLLGGLRLIPCEVWAVGPRDLSQTASRLSIAERRLFF
jgi:hypothetical protein